MDDNSSQPINQSPQLLQISPEPVVQTPSLAPIPAEVQTEASPFYLTFGFWAFIFFLGNLVTIFFLWFYPLLSPPLVVEDQPLAEGFYIKRARVSSPGFVALKVEVVGDEGPKVLTFANSVILIPDTYEDFYISRQDKESVPDEFLSSVGPGSPVLVAVYRDVNEDREFDPGADNLVMKDIFGRRLQTTFILQ